MSEFIKDQRAAIEARIKEIDRQLGEHDSLVSERERLGAVLEALGGSSGAAGRRTGPNARRTGRRRTKRATRGQREREILEFLQKNPASGPSAIAKALGISSAQVSGKLKKMASVDATVRKADQGWELREPARTR